MKNFFKSIAVIALVFSLTSCDNEDTPKPLSGKNIVEIAIEDPDLSLFVDAIWRTELIETLNGPGIYTVFAPRNQAFINWLQEQGFTGLNDPLLNTPAGLDALRKLLLNHVIVSEVRSVSIQTGYVSTLSPINAVTGAPTISMYIEKSGANVFINGGTATTGAKVTTADIVAKNGVIHIVNAVIKIPTIVDHIVANPEFDTLQAVVTSTSGDFGNQSAVLSALTGLTSATPATVFAPSNAAFTAATTGSGFAVGATPQQVSTVLQYHVTLAGNLRSSQLINDQTIPMITNPIQTTTVVLGGGTVDIRDTAQNLSRVFQADIQCSNGVIHGVNSVLQPAL